MGLVAHGSHHLEVPEDPHNGSPMLRAFASGEIRDDVLRSHIAMGLLVSDGEMGRRHRFADHTVLNTEHQRARLLWKSRKRFVPPPPEPPDHDWRALQTVWPHHSLRGDDWCVVPAESQPTMPLRGLRWGAGLAKTSRSSKRS